MVYLLNTKFMSVERNVFEPVPSRRLGKSLGVNNIPHKVCTYSCLYCQVGKADKMQLNRQVFYTPEKLIKEVEKTLRAISDSDEYSNYIAIVPDGEPTLDINLGILIEKLKATNIPVAVITNASLLYLSDVQNDLSRADYVSLKVDTVNSSCWKKMHHPVKSLELSTVLLRIEQFARNFTGKLVTETMVVKNYNDSDIELNNLSSFIHSIEPSVAYLVIPTRPPAYEGVLQPDTKTITKAYHIFSDSDTQVELLTGYEGNAFSSTGKPKEDIFSITAIHPMQEKALEELLHKTDTEFAVVDAMLNKGLLNKINYLGNIYYTSNFDQKRPAHEN